ncbi:MULTISPECIES: DNA cytosine methyltransferase [unclassified Gemella]|uniref:DNA cytosine methyltransferase n=1 Tax=unclassified Gemella TaxID=2624949 RepID=UPI001C049596|nr:MULTISPECIES: DNA cytosine methyltransferase [unclassified Gemella]MBU0278743.1 DNA cytosine methyltransferase [Gemella sp. zg-1178]QWQ38684.1 DNA cytosine methyltransferase [Gemella sp. zg-570]
MKIKFIDLFAGIGGFRLALEKNGGTCVFSSEIDKFASETYFNNFGEFPSGDIFKIKDDEIPNHNILCAGFPCQPFSLAGKRLGFNDVRGTLFFEVARILKSKKPEAFILENVAGIVSHDNEKTLETIENILTELGYKFSWKLLNAKNYGIPQNRNRWYCVGVRNEFAIDIDSVFPEKIKLSKTLKNIIEMEIKDSHIVSDTAIKNISKHVNSFLEKSNNIIYNEPIIANNIRPSKVSFSANGISPCLTAKMGTGGNNVPVVVELNRKYTITECLAIMGFPSNYKIKDNYSQSYKQIGNSVVVPLIELISKNLFKSLEILLQKQAME